MSKHQTRTLQNHSKQVQSSPEREREREKERGHVRVKGDPKEKISQVTIFLNKKRALSFKTI
jgi:hypothetical protein